ncbi:unnamed protein product, partial [Ixodes pacificus]
MRMVERMKPLRSSPLQGSSITELQQWHFTQRKIKLCLPHAKQRPPTREQPIDQQHVYSDDNDKGQQHAGLRDVTESTYLSSDSKRRGGLYTRHTKGRDRKTQLSQQRVLLLKLNLIEMLDVTAVATSKTVAPVAAEARSSNGGSEDVGCLGGTSTQTGTVGASVTSAVGSTVASSVGSTVAPTVASTV